MEIPFELRFADQPLSCASGVDGTTLTDLRFYVHDLRLVTSTGEETAVRLIPDPLWQNDEVALLDFESGEGDCVNGTPATNTVIRGSAPDAEYTGMRFRLGVPEHLNHADPLQAAAPLGYSFMHWHWRTGYKFLRAGVARGDDRFWLHLGSARCVVDGCRSANRPSVALGGYATGQAVVVDLQKLAQGIDLQDGTPSDCSSGPAENECRHPFGSLGLDFDSGEAVAGASIFRLGARQ